MGPAYLSLHERAYPGRQKGASHFWLKRRLTRKRELLQNKGVDPKGTTSHSCRELPHKQGRSLALNAKTSSMLAFMIELRGAKEAAVQVAT
jgi:hypothetical protein